MNTTSATEFRILTKMKEFILLLDKALMNFPKREKVLHDRLENTTYETLELITYANLKEKDIEEQRRIISKISMIDYYLELSLKKQYINEKLCKNLCDELRNITKMIYGWIKING